MVFGDTGRVGVYEVEADGRPLWAFAVNLLDSAESDLTPRESFRVGADTINSEPAKKE